MQKIRVYLGDLVHTWEKVSTWVMPLNVGLIGAYANKELGRQVEISLFKCPTKMINAIKSSPPNVVALSHYVWNVNLNNRVFEVSKNLNSEILTVGGGPLFTLHNAHQEIIDNFFRSYKNCDAWVLNQGEKGFVALLKVFLENNIQASRVCEPVEGCITFSPTGSAHLGPALDPLKDLDEIPSPYLTGLLDPFFEMGLTPMIETNRSCPYRCTFCAFGIGSTKLSRYSDERVKEDIDYIAKRSKNSPSLFIADANFSILQRDIDFARHIYKSHVDKGWPGQVACYWNKSNPKQVMKVAKEFKGLCPVGASMQSLNPDTLGAIKRSNLPLEKIVEMASELSKFNKKSHLYSELIVGLPQETLKDHLEANRVLMDLGAEVSNYNLHLIPGTEMETEAGRKEFVRETSWRLHDNAFGVYDNMPVFEGQEVVKETTTASKDEIQSLRFIHFLFQFMWGKRWYRDFLIYFKNLGIHPLDTMLRIAEEWAKNKGVMGEIYKNFQADYQLESFGSSEDLFQYWGKPENLERLRAGDYGKLNFQYTFIVLREHPDVFDQFLIDLSSQMISELSSSETIDERIEQCSNILRFFREQRVEITSKASVVKNKRVVFDYDIAGWVKNGSVGVPKKATNDSVFEYEFFLSAEQLNLLENMLLQYRSKNSNLTLRKMTEYCSPRNLFYEVRDFSHPWIEGTKAATTNPVWIGHTTAGSSY